MQKKVVAKPVKTVESGISSWEISLEYMEAHFFGQDFSLRPEAED